MNGLDLSSLEHYAGKNVLVTGGLGMIGSFAATEAVKHGANVTILDNKLPDHGANEFNIARVVDKVKLIIGDIRDLDTMVEAVKGQDVIFHCAAHVSYTDSMKDPFIDLEINARGHLNVLEACRHNNVNAKIIFCSSRMRYGNVLTNPVEETHPTSPLMIYGAHKLLGEKYNEIYYKNYNIQYVNLVVPNPYGPRQQMIHHKYGLVNWFIRIAMEGGEISLFGEGDQVRDYIYVEDISNAILLAGIKEEAVATTMNLGNGEGTSLRTMVDTVLAEVGSGTMKHVEWPEDYRAIETGDYVADIRKASSLGYAPSVNFKEGVKRTVEFYKQNRQHYWS